MSRRKFQTIYLVAVIIPFLMLIFPLFEIGNRATPIVLGLPFSFFWVILWIVITFLIITGLYFIDPDHKEEKGE